MNGIHRLKRGVALVMAAVTAAGGLVFAPQRAAAAVPGNFQMEAMFDRTVSVSGAVNNLPLLVPAKQAGETTVHFPLDVNASDDGTYVLTYAIADGRFVEFTIVKNGNDLRAAYREYNGDPNQAAPLIPVVEKTYPMADFRVFAGNGNTPWQEPLVYVSEAAHQLMGTDTGNTYKAGDAPQFSITRGTGANGFAFQVGTRPPAGTVSDRSEVRFLWDANGFWYTTNGVAKGLLYTFTLTKGGAKDSVKAFDGYKDDIVKAVPRSSAPSEGAGAVDPTLDYADPTNAASFGYVNSPAAPFAPGAPSANVPPFLDPAPYNDMHVFDMMAVVPPVPRDKPGDGENWVDLEIPLPKCWNPTENTFTKTITTADMPQLGLHIVLYQRPASAAGGRNYSQDAVFENIFSTYANPAYKLNTYANDACVSYGKCSADAFYARFTKLAGGVLYDSCTISFSSDDRAWPDTKFAANSTVLESAVYTLLNYEVYYNDAQLVFNVNTYEGHTGSYVLKYGVSQGSLATAMTVPVTANEKRVQLSLGISPAARYFYQIVFTETVAAGAPRPKGIDSQRIYFGVTPEALGISKPSGFEIVPGSVDMTTIRGNSTEQKLTYAMKWNIIGYATLTRMLDALKDKGMDEEIIVVYDLYDTLSPLSASPDTLYGQVRVRFHRNMEPGFSDGQVYVDFSQADSLNVVKIKETKNNPVLSPNYAENYQPNPALATVKAYVQIEESTVHKAGTQTVPAGRFRYPNIYFLNVRASSSTYGSVPPDASLYDSMTLNDLSGLEPPPAQNIMATPVPVTPIRGALETRFTVPMDKLREYIRKNPSYSIYDVQYNIYVSQDEAKLKAAAAANPDPQLANADKEAFVKVYTPYWGGADGKSTVAPFQDDWLTAELAGGKLTGRVYFSAVDGGGAGVTAADGKTLLAHLRGGDIVRLSGLQLFKNSAGYDALVAAAINGTGADVAFVLDGLDKNQKYYVQADVNVLLKDTAADPAYEEWHWSKLSGIAGVTTLDELVVPNPDELTPPMPSLNKETPVGLSNATIYWNRVKDPKPSPLPSPDPYGTLEYEIIRLKDAPMPSATPPILDDRLATFEQVYDKITKSEKMGWRTRPSEPNVNGEVTSAATLQKYDGGGKFTDVTGTDPYKWSAAEPLKLDDASLRPNTVYYYYARTVRVLANKRLYSPWAAVSVTTTPVRAPINLTVLRDGSVSYDATKEFVVYFDAPIDANNWQANFNFQFQLKEEANDWKILPAGQAQFISVVAGQRIDGVQYSRFTYKISGLNYGKGYSIQVRMQDLTQNDYSGWSNTAQTRTELDNDEYEKDKNTGDWLQYIKDKLEALFREDYWALSDSGVYLYRPSMFDGVLLKNPGAQVQLAAANGTRVEYLIPQSGLMSMNSQNKGFVFQRDGAEIIISPKAVTDALDAVRQAKERISSKNALDYYVRVVVSQSVYTQPIDGKNPATPQYDVTVEIVTAKKAAKALDTELMAEAVARLTSDGAAETIKKMIDAGRKPEDIIAYIDTYIQSSLRAFYPYAARMYNGQADRTFVLTELAQPVYIKHTAADASAAVKGYRREQTGWAAQTLQTLGAAKAIVTKQTGAYIFTESTLNMPGLVGLPDADALTGLIIKYGLDDYLGKGDAFKPDGKLTAYAVAGTVSRLAGAKQTDNPTDFLKGKGYTVTARNSGQAATVQESVYMVMALYEMKTNLKAANVRVTNYAATAGVQIDSRYLPYVRAANELGVFQAKGMQPTAGVTTKELLAMISNLNKKVKL